MIVRAFVAQTIIEPVVARPLKTGIWLGLLLLSPSLACVARAQVPVASVSAGLRIDISPLTSEAAKEAVRRMVNGLPDEMLARFVNYSPVAIPAMFEMLQDTSEMRYWPNAVLALGWVGRETTVPPVPLIEFLERPGPFEPSSADHWNRDKHVHAQATYIYPAALEAKRNVLLAIGSLIQNSRAGSKLQFGQSEGLDYLRAGSQSSFWQSRIEWNSAPHYRTDLARNVDFAAAAVEGLNLACIAETRQMYARSTTLAKGFLPKSCSYASPRLH